MKVIDSFGNQVKEMLDMVVLFPMAPRLNGKAILRKGMAGAVRQRLLSQGVDLEALVDVHQPTYIPKELVKPFGFDHGMLFVPAVDINNGTVDWTKVQEAVLAFDRPLAIPYWDSQSREFAEVLGKPVFVRAETFRARLGKELEVPWNKETSMFITVNPRVSIRQDVAEAFIEQAKASGMETLVTLARVSNLPLIQAAKISNLQVYVVNPGTLKTWREDTLRNLEDPVRIIDFSDEYTPGAFVEAVRWAVANTKKSFGVEPPGLRSEAGLVPQNLWSRIQAV